MFKTREKILMVVLLCILLLVLFQIVRNCGKQREEDVPPPWLIHNLDKRDVYWSDGKLRQEYVDKLEYEGVAGSEEANLEYTDLHITDDSTVEVYSLPECTYIRVKKVSYNNVDSYYTYILYETNGQEVNFTEAEKDEIYQYIDLVNEIETSKN